MKLKRMIGIAGVPLDAPYKAQRWGKHFERGLVFIFILILFRWSLKQNDVLPYSMERLSSWIIWGYFVIEMVVCSTLVDNRKRYLLGNWANWIIIILGFPVLIYHTPYISLIRIMRGILILRFSKRYVEDSFKAITRRYWLYTMAVLLSIVFVSALVLTIIDPAFTNISDGLWFAWESMTTVGYGDFIPKTNAGRLFTSIIIILGVIIVSMMTASFAAFIINKDEDKVDISNIKKSLESIKVQLTRIEDKISEKEHP